MVEYMYGSTAGFFFNGFVVSCDVGRVMSYAVSCFWQDRAWKDTTVSVFDLENMEEDGELRGEEMPWANDK